MPQADPVVVQEMPVKEAAKEAENSSSGNKHTQDARPEVP